MPTTSASSSRSSYIKRPVPATPPLSARIARAAGRSAAIAASVAGFIGIKMAVRSDDPMSEQLIVVAVVFGAVFVLAALAQLFGAKPVEGSDTGNLQISRGFAIAVIGGVLALFAWGAYAVM